MTLLQKVSLRTDTVKKAVIARRYAKALLDVGIEEKAYERFGHELRTVYGVFEGTPELYKVLLNPMFRVEDRRALMERIAGAIGASPVVERLLAVLVDRRHVKLLGDMVDSYSKFEDAAAGRIRAVVESPAELTQEMLGGIKRRISELTGKEVLLSYRRNDGLLGGVLIRIENTIIDGSLRTQLDAVKERIAASFI